LYYKSQGGGEEFEALWFGGLVLCLWKNAKVIIKGLEAMVGFKLK
jgi:hypothetical protein